MFRLDLQRVIFNNLIGSGRFGNVYPYQKSPNDDKWAVKIQNCISNQLPQKIQEIVLGFSFDHPNILPIKGFHMDFNKDKNNWEIYTKMPRMIRTLLSRLNDNIKENKYFSDKEIIQYFYDVTSGLTYLHQRKIAHRDIKLDNILLDKNGSAVLSDVGLGKFIDDQSSYLTQERPGAISYIAPEVLEADGPLKRKSFYKADAWSLGMTIAELCLLKTNFLKFHLSGEQKEKQLVQQLEAIREKYNDNSFLDLVLMLLKHDPNKRASVEEVKQKLEAKYANIIRSIRDSNKSSREGIFLEEKKSPELISNEGRHHENKEGELNSQIWRDKIEAINKEFGETKNEFLKFKKERLRALIQDIERPSTSDFEGEKLFIHEVGTHKNLAGIKIKPKDPSKIIDEDIKKLIESFTKQLNQHNWRQLDLLFVDLDNCKQITDDALAELAIEIGTKLTNLKWLRLDFYYCNNLTNKGVGHLTSQIGNKLISLEILVIYFFDSPNITDDGAQELVSEIAKNLKNLQELGLGFGGCNVSDTTINEIIKYLPNQLQNFTKLFIYFDYCSKVTENTAIELVDQIAINLKNLEGFELGLKRCNISDKILHQLAKRVENSFNNLKHLGLYFTECENINDKAILELVQKISFKKIHTLTLDLQGCIQISDQTFRSIGHMIESNLKTLQTLTLWFNGLSLKNETKKFLRELLQNIPHLKLEF